MMYGFDVTSGSKKIDIKMTTATGWKLERQRPADSAFGMLKFDSSRDKLNFKMYCAYCHQIGTVGFRTRRRNRGLGDNDPPHGRLWGPLSPY